MERFPWLHARESASLHSPSRPTANSLPPVSKTQLPSIANLTSSSLPIAQPTSALPLTTTFTPPASCLEQHLTQLPPPGYLIWANEPVPAANSTASACYPVEFLKEYKSASSGIVGSSVVPVLSPLVCPSNFCTMFAGEDNYVACCLSGYQFHRPDTTVDANRPGYGGRCYSDFVVRSTYIVTAYNTNGSSNIAIWTASTSGCSSLRPPPRRLCAFKTNTRLLHTTTKPEHSAIPH
ncbi:hypothetical protein BCR34DRAFT_75775 [Clohesyomyces aquaticus]|uniref:Uncharacterized protein n=1 Tax=Clohesyomyces aquaticus TaxID=1231657 RepID=A0A1Y2A3A8_9PLEO|nr:hypothetical protein BCR34DRAFT_75775 [Clohesyomyces aquaticus]